MTINGSISLKNASLLKAHVPSPTWIQLHVTLNVRVIAKPTPILTVTSKSETRNPIFHGDVSAGRLFLFTTYLLR
jgi:hypothetical protein